MGSRAIALGIFGQPKQLKGFGISLLTRDGGSAPAQKPHPLPPLHRMERERLPVSGKPPAGGVGVRHKTAY